MSYTHNPSDPMVILAGTANTLLQQYQTEAITLEQFKDAMNTQVVPLVSTLDKSSHNDNAMHTISYAVAMLGAVE
jgi:hypothetical protein